MKPRAGSLKRNQQDRQTLNLRDREAVPQINKIKNEKGDLTTETEEIKRIIRSYFKGL